MMRRERVGGPIQRPGPGTPVAVVGLARSGAAAAALLLKQGSVVRVTEAARTPALERAASELRAAGAQVELGRHTPAFIRGARLVVVSPGVRFGAPPLRWARASGIPVVSELELAAWYCPGRIVAVTGSNGKSTVVTLLGAMLQAAGREAVVCGNIGDPFSGQLERIGPRTVVVLEVSSFQLQTTLSFRPHVGCVLNVTPNHLDRHSSFEAYRAAKARIVLYQQLGDWAVLNADDPGSSGLRDSVRMRLVSFSRKREVVGSWLDQGVLWLNLPGLRGEICRVEELPARGAHHEENALAASALAGLVGVEPALCGRALRSFQGLPHRQEVVAVIRGVTFVNDSKATTVEAGLRAIESSPAPVVLIAGGRDKGSDFRLLRPLARRLRAAVLIGEDGPKIAAALRGTVPVQTAGDLGEAVRKALGAAMEGDRVVLSPMCTSFDMFKDFEQRGEQFVEAVRAL